MEDAESSERCYQPHCRSQVPPRPSSWFEYPYMAINGNIEVRKNVHLVLFHLFVSYLKKSDGPTREPNSKSQIQIPLAQLVMLNRVNLSLPLIAHKSNTFKNSSTKCTTLPVAGNCKTCILRRLGNIYYPPKQPSHTYLSIPPLPHKRTTQTRTDAQEAAF